MFQPVASTAPFAFPAPPHGSQQQLYDRDHQQQQQHAIGRSGSAATGKLQTSPDPPSVPFTGTSVSRFAPTPYLLETLYNRIVFLESHLLQLSSHVALLETRIKQSSGTSSPTSNNLFPPPPPSFQHSRDRQQSDRRRAVEQSTISDVTSKLPSSEQHQQSATAAVLDTFNSNISSLKDKLRTGPHGRASSSLGFVSSTRDDYRGGKGMETPGMSPVNPGRGRASSVQPLPLPPGISSLSVSNSIAAKNKDDECNYVGTQFLDSFLGGSNNNQRNNTEVVETRVPITDGTRTNNNMIRRVVPNTNTVYEVVEKSNTQSNTSNAVPLITSSTSNLYIRDWHDDNAAPQTTTGTSSSSTTFFNNRNYRTNDNNGDLGPSNEGNATFVMDGVSSAVGQNQSENSVGEARTENANDATDRSDSSKLVVRYSTNESYFENGPAGYSPDNTDANGVPQKRKTWDPATWNGSPTDDPSWGNKQMRAGLVSNSNLGGAGPPRVGGSGGMLYCSQFNHDRPCNRPGCAVNRRHLCIRCDGEHPAVCCRYVESVTEFKKYCFYW